MILDGRGDYGAIIWRVLAFGARYGHQPLDVLLTMPTIDLQRFTKAVGSLIERESEGSGPDPLMNRAAVGG